MVDVGEELELLKLPEHLAGDEVGIWGAVNGGVVGKEDAMGFETVETVAVEQCGRIVSFGLEVELKSKIPLGLASADVGRRDAVEESIGGRPENKDNLLTSFLVLVGYVEVGDGVVELVFGKSPREPPTECGLLVLVDDGVFLSILGGDAKNTGIGKIENIWEGERHDVVVDGNGRSRELTDDKRCGDDVASEMGG